MIECGLVLSVLVFEVVMTLIWSPLENISSQLLTLANGGYFDQRVAEHPSTFVMSVVALKVFLLVMIETGNKDLLERKAVIVSEYVYVPKFASHQVVSDRR